MQNRIITIIILFVASGFFSIVRAQDASISPTKKALIGEMISVTKADQQVEASMRTMFDQLDRGYPEMVKQLVVKRSSNLSAAEQKEIVDLLVKQNSGQQSYRERILAAIDFREYIEKALYPLYDKFFTEAELADLLAFYKSSTGRKLNQVMPQLFGESVRLAQEILIPKVVAATESTIDSDLAKARESITTKSKKN